MFKKISIIGVGLIGGSIGMAARKRRLSAEVIGIGRRVSSIKKAVSKGAVDKATLDLKEGVKNADLIIVAVPVEKVIAKIKEAARYAKKGAIITDVTSIKAKVVKEADRVMPAGVYFVGTHPIAGSEQSGVFSAAAGLFKDTACVITPTRHTDKKALAKIKRFWESLGAHVEFLSPQAHDLITANISHMPHALSYCLCNAVPSKGLNIAGSGFRDTTRIAKSNPAMWAEIMIQNRKALLKSIGNFQAALGSLKADIRAKRKTRLFQRLNAAKRKRDSIG